MIERTRIRSDTPGIPGSRQQPPRTMRSTSTPARDASYSASIDLRVDERVDLEHDPRRVAGLRVGDLALHELEESRAQRDRRHQQPAEHALAREAGERVEQVRDVGAELLAAGEEPQVHVQAGGLAVVVAGADVDVAAQAGALAPDDEQRPCCAS